MDVDNSSPAMIANPACDPSRLIFGSFTCPIILPDIKERQQMIMLPSPQISDPSHIWNSIDDNILYQILDLRQATYCDKEIMDSLGISSIPPLKYIYICLGRCQTCFVIGHTAENCPGISCNRCHQLERVCDSCSASSISGYPKPRKACNYCNSLTHESWFCAAFIFCRNCGYLGHLGRECKLGLTRMKRLYWRKLVDKPIDPLKKIRYNQIWVPKQKVSAANPAFSANHTSPPRLPSPIDEWPVYSGSSASAETIAAAADDFINGRSKNSSRLTCAGGAHQMVLILDNPQFLLFLGQLVKLVYTPRISQGQNMDTSNSIKQHFPLNPFAIVSEVIYAVATAASYSFAQMSVPSYPVQDVLKNEMVIDLNAWRPVAKALMELAPFHAFELSLITQPSGLTIGPALDEAQNQPEVLRSTNLPSINCCDDSESSDSAGLMEVDTKSMVMLMAGIPCKRRHPTVPVDITEVRRSTRSTRFMGFRPPSLADVQKRITHVKPRIVPEISPADVDMDSHQDTASSYTCNQVQIPPNTPLKTLQMMGTKECGIPEAELTDEILLSEEDICRK